MSIFDFPEPVDYPAQVTEKAFTVFQDKALRQAIAFAPGTAGGAETLDELTDVVILDPVNNDTLTYDSESGFWTNQAPAMRWVNVLDQSGLTLTYVGAADNIANDGLALRQDGYILTNEYPDYPTVLTTAGESRRLRLNGLPVDEDNEGVLRLTLLMAQVDAADSYGAEVGPEILDSGDLVENQQYVIKYTGTNNYIRISSGAPSNQALFRCKLVLEVFAPAEYE